MCFVARRGLVQCFTLLALTCSCADGVPAVVLLRGRALDFADLGAAGAVCAGRTQRVLRSGGSSSVFVGLRCSAVLLSHVCTQLPFVLCFPSSPR